LKAAFKSLSSNLKLGHVMDLLIDRLPQGIEDNAKALLRDAGEKSLALATAESCTGGLLAALLTDVEGFSRAFERGFIVYSESAKTEMLGVSSELIAIEGAVSRAVAEAMARGAIEHSGADVALAITGFAGPGAPTDETGLVHLACQRRGGEIRHREEHFGERGRAAIRAEAIKTAIAMMHGALSQ
jgi:nicotinamide-nucleotide amidase